MITYHNANFKLLIQNDRKEGGDTHFEWFSWLADRLLDLDSGKDGPQAANIEYTNWKPPDNQVKLYF